MKAWKHFKTITYHKWLVCKGCFAIGLYKQGLVHDLSKYSPTEFRVGARYFQGTRSPNAAERDDIGYSTAWLHHKGRNRHHFEYWFDFGSKGPCPAPMPHKYLAEMVVDRIAASKVYKGKDYTDDAALKYFEMGSKIETDYMHPYTREKLEMLLRMLAEKGEKETFSYIKNVFLKAPSGAGQNKIK